MAALHEALTYLKPVSWADVPTSTSSSSSSTTELQKYTQEILDKAKLIIESVPEQNPSSASLSHVGTFNAASIPKLDSLRKEWGKPLKMNNAKENPLNTPVYKLSGKDGKGAWFARRSVHKGLPFGRWKAKMQAEMEESLKARQEEIKQGRTPEMCIRGIGADRKLEQVDIRRDNQDGDSDRNGDKDDGKALASIVVYQQSAQFPGPTTARDFVTMMITTDAMLSDGAESDPPSPPSYIIVSKPCQHPDAPMRSDYIRGQYESVELIREIPTEKSATSMNTKNGDSDSTQTSNANSENEEYFTPSTIEYSPNAVEWIMITRSDPGGSVPKWMVERGTPKSITGDMVKFLNWASKPDEGDDTADIAELTESAENKEDFKSIDDRYSQLSTNDGTVVADQQPDAVDTNDKGVEQINQSLEETEDDDDGGHQEDRNIWSNVAKMVHTGLDYAPRAVLNYIPGRLSPSFSSDINKEGEDESRDINTPMEEAKDGSGNVETDDAPGDKTAGIDEANDTSSLASDNESFTSADSHVTSSVTGDATPQIYAYGSQKDGPSQSINAITSDAAVERPAGVNSTKKLSSREKELAKLNARKKEIEINLSSVRNEIRELQGPTSKGSNSNFLYADVDSVHSSNISGESSSNDNSNKTSHHSDTKDAKHISSPNDPATPSSSSSATMLAAYQQNHKRIEQLLRTESKLIARLSKTEARQVKVSEKLEAEQRKAAEREDKTRSRSEIETLRREIASLRSELRELRDERQKWLDIVGTLQKENTRLVDQARKHGSREGYGTD